MKTVTVALATIGRPTLPAALASCLDADEVVVVWDDAVEPEVTRLATRHPNLVVARVWGGNRGWTAHNRGIELAISDLIAFMDDDDVYLPGAIDAIREHASLTNPTVFQVDCPWNGIVPNSHELRFGNISTQGLVVPNIKDKLGVWGEHQNNAGGDYTFLKGTVAKMGEIHWVDEVIAVVRPHERPGLLAQYAA